tara:strand:- start:8510 stop:8638 length:129 start_codon:yes stop_codon:yes gene_type:complete
MNGIHTNCVICGGSLLHPDEIKLGYHEECAEMQNKRVHSMRG